MTPLLVGLVLTAAVLHAAWNAMAKSGGAPEFSIASYQVVGAGLCLMLTPFIAVPHPDSWPMIFASVVIHNFYYWTLAGAYRSGDLSQVYPLFRGLAPVLVTLGAGVVAHEWLSPGTMLGIGLVSAGIISLAFFGRRLGAMPRAALFWGLSTSVLIAAYTVVDGMGVRVAESKIGYILWLFVFEPVPIGLYLLARRRGEWGDYLRAKPFKILAGAVMSSSAYGLVIFAMSLGAMAVVSSLRETSVIFAALIGTLKLGEPFGRARVMAATVVAVGVVAIRVLG